MFRRSASQRSGFIQACIVNGKLSDGAIANHFLTRCPDTANTAATAEKVPSWGRFVETRKAVAEKLIAGVSDSSAPIKLDVAQSALTPLSDYGFSCLKNNNKDDKAEAPKIQIPENAAWCAPDHAEGLPVLENGKFTKDTAIRCYVPSQSAMPQTIIFCAQNSTDKADISIYQAGAYLTEVASSTADGAANSSSSSAAPRLFEAKLNASTVINKLDSIPSSLAGRIVAQYRLDAAAVSSATMDAYQSWMVNLAAKKASFDSLLCRQQATHKLFAVTNANQFALESVASFVAGENENADSAAPVAESAILKLLLADHLSILASDAKTLLGPCPIQEANLSSLESISRHLVYFDGSPLNVATGLTEQLLRDVAQGKSGHKAGGGSGGGALGSLTGKDSLASFQTRFGSLTAPHVNLATSTELIYKDFAALSERLATTKTVQPFLCQTVGTIVSELFASLCVLYRVSSSFDLPSTTDERMARDWVTAQVFLDASHRRRRQALRVESVCAATRSSVTPAANGVSAEVAAMDFATRVTRREIPTASGKEKTTSG